jgi:acetyl-CoA acetyltransferase
MPDLTLSAAAESGLRAYAMAGVGPEDVDVAMLYDAFTSNTVLFLEDLGFCEKGGWSMKSKTQERIKQGTCVVRRSRAGAGVVDFPYD